MGGTLLFSSVTFAIVTIVSPRMHNDDELHMLHIISQISILMSLLWLHSLHKKKTSGKDNLLIKDKMAGHSTTAIQALNSSIAQ